MKNFNKEFNIQKDDINYKKNTLASFYMLIHEIFQKYGPITIYELTNSEYEAENEETKEKEPRIFYNLKFTVKNEPIVKETKIPVDKSVTKIQTGGVK